MVPLVVDGVTEIELVTEVPVHPVGKVQVQLVAPGTAATEQVYVEPEHTAGGPEIGPGCVGVAVTVTANVCVALEYNISSLSENEIQRAVWPAEKEEIELEQSTETETDEINYVKNTSVVNESSSDSDSDSDDGSWEEWQRTLEERKKAIEEKWQLFERGNKLAEPHSIEWNKANFLNSREHIELLQRTDGKPIQPYEIHYTVEPTPLVLDGALHLSKSSRLVLVDLGFACTFEECEKLPLYTPSDYRPPEALLGLPVTHKADIFSAGLLCWEIVMLRRLVETRFSSDDPERVYSKNRLLRDLVQRIGPFPYSMRAQWTDADKFIDSEGIALEIQEYDGEIYGPDDFEYGDIWHQAKNRKPLDMSDPGLELFISLIQEMLQFNPELRPSTTELLQHEWFIDMKQFVLWNGIMFRNKGSGCIIRVFSE